MKRNLCIVLALIALVCGAGQLFKVAAHEGTHAHNAFTPDTIPWGPAPPFIRPGAQLAAGVGSIGGRHYAISGL